MTADSHSIRPERVVGLGIDDVARIVGTANPGDSGRITGVAAASSEVHPGDVFFALPGASQHGARFAGDAIARGAIAIITDDDGAAALADVTVPVLVHANPRSQLGIVSAQVYGTAQTKPRLFGITGTNGKTSAVYMLTAMLTQLGHVTGMSSTSERFIAGQRFESKLTTPEANEMHAFVARMIESGVTDAVLEVSAHALSRHRVDGFVFDVVGFTNFSQDHLDDYDSMEEYFAAKQQLFTRERARAGVVVLDSRWSQRLVADSEIPVQTIALEGTAEADWTVSVTGRSARQTAFRLADKHGNVLESTVPLVGDFSAVNAALAIVMCLSSGLPLADIANALAPRGIVVEIPGRTEIVSGEQGPTFFVDYGHTPEAFAATLAALRAVTAGRLIMVCGADGDRDTTKRESMGANAARGSDVLIITDYHPRTEDPAVIRAQLLAGARNVGSACDIFEEPDPRLAVRLAVSLAGEGDTILYAGPGHETYRDVGTERIAYSARDDARQSLLEAGWS